MSAVTTPDNAIDDTRSVADEVPPVDHYVVCGRGALSLRLAGELRYAGVPVRVVCEGATEAERQRVSAMGAELVEGSPTDESVLRRAGVATSRSIAAVAEDDVGNLRIGFAAQKVNPTIRVVIGLFNEDMGQHIESLFHDCVIISASAIAAPFFVAAALGHVERQHIVVSGRALQVARFDETIAGKGNSAGVLAVLARSGSNGDGTVTLFPPSPALGDVVLRDLGRADDIDPLLAAQHHVSRHGRVWTRLQESASTARAFFDHRFRILFAVIALMVAVSVEIFAHFKHLPVISALYFTIVTLSTVGYGDINLQYDPHWMKLYGVGFILVGATTIAIFYSFLIDTLVGVRLARALGTVHTKMKHHIIVCGLGNTGYRVAERLKGLGLEVLVVDRDENNRHFPAVRAQGIPIVIGDASLVETLSAAQVESADCLITCTDDDIIGLEAAVNARSLHPDLRIVLRLFDDEISKRVEHSLSIRFSRSMASLAAPVFATQMMPHALLQAVTVGRTARTTIVIGELEVDSGSNLDDMSVGDVEESGCIRVLSITRTDEEPEWLPFDSTRRLRADDRILIAATREEWRRLIA